MVAFKNGSVFQGEWQKNLANGFGSLKFPNGDSYEGDYKLGMKQGSGIYKHKTGMYIQNQKYIYTVYLQYFTKLKKNQ